jgi:hypothetical protein
LHVLWKFVATKCIEELQFTYRHQESHHIRTPETLYFYSRNKRTVGKCRARGRGGGQGSTAHAYCCLTDVTNASSLSACVLYELLVAVDPICFGYKTYSQQTNTYRVHKIRKELDTRTVIVLWPLELDLWESLILM